MSLLKIPLPGYSAARPKPGIEWAGDYQGNANYQQGGDKLFATDLGMSGIEQVNFSFGGNSMSQNYTAKAFQPANSSNANEGFAPSYGNITLKWFYAANGVEVANNTNLSAEFVRFHVDGV
jgi:hypothetical protein